MIHHTTDTPKVSVYFNLHRKVFSIRAEEGPCKGKVIAHADDVMLGDVSFTVSAAGRERVRREGRKNVHAFVKGKLIGWTGPNAYATPAAVLPALPFPLCGCWDVVDTGMARLMVKQGQPFTYNPYKDEGFRTYGAMLTRARYAFLSTTQGRRVLV